MRKRGEVIAILCSDLHLSHNPPLARAGEKDWYKAMGRALTELDRLGSYYNVPIICAGDIFDKWNPPPELINFAIERMPNVYAVPGQHDLPYHRYDDIKRSAYWTLVQAGKITDLSPQKPMSFGSDMTIVGFPWGTELKTPNFFTYSRVNLAVVHKYIWEGGKGYPGAALEDMAVQVGKKLDGFSAAVFGDNHKGFHIRDFFQGKGDLLNCGTFMRRKADEIDYQPMVGLLLQSGSIDPWRLDTSLDHISNQHLADIAPENEINLRPFLKTLAECEWSSMGLAGAVSEYLRTNPVSDEAKAIIAEALESHDKR